MSAAHPVEFLLHACHTFGADGGAGGRAGWQLVLPQLAGAGSAHRSAGEPAAGCRLPGAGEGGHPGAQYSGLDYRRSGAALHSCRGSAALSSTCTVEQMSYVLKDAGARLLFAGEKELSAAIALWQGVISQILVLDETRSADRPAIVRCPSGWRQPSLSSRPWPTVVPDWH